MLICVCLIYILASGWGDPHVRTLDGAEYTFNGLGEFVLARTKYVDKLFFIHYSLIIRAVYLI